MNLELVRLRSQVVKSIRAFFDEKGYTEMLTPRLVSLPGQEPYLDPFWTTISVPGEVRSSKFEVRGALVTSPEYSMKKLLAAGMDKIYDLGPCFRNNEPWDVTHDPEFLMLEWYTKNSTIEDLISQTENLIRHVTKTLMDEIRSSSARRATSFELRIPNSKFQIPNSFQRLTVSQAWQDYADVDLNAYLDNREAIAKLAIEKFNQTVTPTDTWDDIYFKIFLSHIEPKLCSSPTWDVRRGTCDESSCVFLYRYPSTQASLSKKCADDPRWADRVELYINGMEMANGFVELCDSVEQRKRFEEEIDLRKQLGKQTWPIDEKLLEALPHMGNPAGIAFGVDRLVMLLAGVDSINDILPFPARERFSS